MVPSGATLEFGVYFEGKKLVKTNVGAHFE
jgi:hypothetical protein